MRRAAKDRTARNRALRERRAHARQFTVGQSVELFHGEAGTIDAIHGTRAVFRSASDTSVRTVALAMLRPRTV